MDRRESPKGLPGSSLNSATRIILLIIVVQIVISLVTYPFMPAIVPSHWGLNGQVNGYAPKWVNAVLFPALSIGIYLIVRVSLFFKMGSYIDDEGRRSNIKTTNLLVVGILLFFLILQIITTAIALGFQLDFTFVMNLVLSVFFIFIGNYLGKLRPNYWAGIRTPWTLANDTVWERTHRIGGWLFVAVGLLGLITSFIPALRFWVLSVALLLVVVILCIYSYMLYSRVQS